MILTRMLSLVTALSIFAVVLSGASHAADDDQFDIVGLKLGMAYAQVKEALVAHDIPAPDMQETRRSYGFGNQIDPPTNGQYLDALYEKYDSPTVPSGNTNISQWIFGAGTMNCLGGSQIVLPIGSRDNTIILEKVFYTSGSSILTDRFRNSRVKGPEGMRQFPPVSYKRF